MGTNECSQPASKSSWDSQDFGDISMVLKMAHFSKSTGPRWVKPWWRYFKEIWNSKVFIFKKKHLKKQDILSRSHKLRTRIFPFTFTHRCVVELNDFQLVIRLIMFSSLLQGSFCVCTHANERWLYIVTSSLIGWVHKQNDPCYCNMFSLYFVS